MSQNKQMFSINDLIPVIEETIASGGSIRFTVTGISMTPILINRRDSVVLSKPDNIKKYDIVLHRRSNGDYILHRVIKRKGNTLTIAGDNEIQKERDVDISCVIGKVTSFTRKGKNYTGNEFWYKLYSRLWVMIFPIRYIVLDLFGLYQIKKRK